MDSFPRLFVFWRVRFVPYFALACQTEILGLYGSYTFLFCLLWAFNVTLKYFSSYSGPLPSGFEIQISVF